MDTIITNGPIGLEQHRNNNNRDFSILRQLRQIPKSIQYTKKITTNYNSTGRYQTVKTDTRRDIEEY